MTWFALRLFVVFVGTFVSFPAVAIIVAVGIEDAGTRAALMLLAVAGMGLVYLWMWLVGLVLRDVKNLGRVVAVLEKIIAVLRGAHADDAAEIEEPANEIAEDMGRWMQWVDRHHAADSKSRSRP